MGMVMTTKTTKSLMVAALIAAIVIPTSAFALDVKSMTAEEELAIVQEHVDKLYAATIEKNNVESNTSSTMFATEQAKSDRVAELEKTILDETQILAEMESKSVAKYALDPEFKEQRTNANAIYQEIIQNNDVPLLGLSLDEDRKSLIIAFDIAKLTSEKNQQYYKELVQEKFAQVTVPIEVIFQEKVGGDESCNYRTSDCNPTWGGVYMQNEYYFNDKCTVGLPIERGTTEGWITAGHCVGDEYRNLTSSSDDVNQPYDTNPKIGEATHMVYSNDCDCAFIKKTSADSWYEGRIWYGYNTYTTINWYTDLVSNGAYVIMTGAPSGPKAGIVNDNAAVSSGFKVVELTTDISQQFDSGAPYTNTAKNTFYGTHKGKHSITDNSIFVPWGQIKDSTTGIGPF
jgi:hypothetical protein